LSTKPFSVLQATQIEYKTPVVNPPNHGHGKGAKFYSQLLQLLVGPTDRYRPDFNRDTWQKIHRQSAAAYLALTAGNTGCRIATQIPGDRRQDLLRRCLNGFD
jgi:hypothetical protein